MATAHKKILVTFDFDWSLSDQDTDRWVLEVNAPHLRRKMKTLKGEVQWTDLVAQTLKEAHAEGVTREQIEHSLKIMPFHPAMMRAVRSLKQRNPNVEYLILSNANSVYISTILAEHGLTDLFPNIITNPACWTADGALDVRRRVDPNGPQHQCKIGCSPNMCKGDELEAFIAARGGWEAYDQVVYVGDGGNDFCPALHLRSTDLLLARFPRALTTRIAADGERLGLKCEVSQWVGAWEVEEYFAALAGKA